MAAGIQFLSIPRFLVEHHAHHISILVTARPGNPHGTFAGDLAGGANVYPTNGDLTAQKTTLVGGLEHEFYVFPFSWECHNPN